MDEGLSVMPTVTHILESLVKVKLRIEVLTVGLMVRCMKVTGKLASEKALAHGKVWMVRFILDHGSILKLMDTVNTSGLMEMCIKGIGDSHSNMEKVMKCLPTVIHTKAPMFKVSLVVLVNTPGLMAASMKVNSSRV